MNQQQYQGPPPKIQKLDISGIINEVKSLNLNTKEDKINYLKKYKYIKTDYNFLYNIIIENDLKNSKSKEMNILNMMITKIDDINNNKVTKRKGEEDIGQVLVDTYIKPKMKEAKNE